jgi:hypothetical protein
MKYTKNFYPMALHNTYTKICSLGMKIYHLATLL